MLESIITIKAFKHPAVLAALFLISGVANAIQPGVENLARCLHGQVKSAGCEQTLANYWKVEELINQAAQKEGMEPALMKALVAIESSYNYQAGSHAGARGLTQVMPATGLGLGVEPNALWHPQTNLAAGTKYLAMQWRTFGDWRLALAAYNAGPQAVMKYRGIPPYPETQAYVTHVLWMYKLFKDKENAVKTATIQ